MQSTMKSDVKAKLSHSEDAVNDLKRKAEETSETVKGDIREIANDAGRRVREFISGCKDELDDTTRTVTLTIRKKPIQSSLIALGAGFLLGALLRRR